MGFFSLTKKKVPCFFYIFLVFMYILTVSKFNIEWKVEFFHFNHVLKFLSKNKNKNQCLKVINKK